LNGRYTELSPDQSLAFTWQHHRINRSGARESTPESLVTITLTPHGESTRLTLVHSNVQTEGGRNGVGHGWNVVLGRLAEEVGAS
ncbi:MAG: SRPBCC family protein, partial [Pseudomonadales bacterium]